MGSGQPMGALQPGDPDVVGRYRLLSRLGAGGMGQVFLGVSPGGRKVAVKLIHPVHASTAEFRARFAREIEAARRVGGFHTAPVVDADPQADPPWMVTAYIDGPSLQDDVDQRGPLSPEGVRAIGAGLAEGLAAIHASGLVHRDLKPGNVILAADGPRIIDFGIARAVDATTGLTTPGTVLGTVAYASPEQIRGDPAGSASDVFSLGGVLAFAATGRAPFGGDSAAAVMFRIVSQPPDLAGVLDRELAGLIEGCLAKAPGDRPAVPDLLAAVSGTGQAHAPTGAVLRHVAGGDVAGRGVAAAEAGGMAATTRAPAAPETGPGRPALPPPLTGGATPVRAVRSRHSGGRSRRGTTAVVAALALVGVLAIALVVVLATDTPRATAGHRVGAAASIGRAATTPDHGSPSPSRSPSPSPSPSPVTRQSGVAPLPTVSDSAAVAPPDPNTAQRIAYDMMSSFGFSPTRYYGCLLDLWNRESGWRYDAENASGAYGIPLALPGSKMASAGPDWKTDPTTQIKWGLGYIKTIYGNPCSAWAFEQANGYY
jgi:Protein kinase domain